MAKKTRITRQDIQFFPSERLTDNDDGGGMPIGTPLTGAPNELFNPISSIARLNGAFYVHLVYMGVMRPDDEMLIGSFAAITKPPKDPTTSYLLCAVDKFGALRHEIVSDIESDKVASIESRMTLLSTQTKNSNLIQAYQRVEEPLPLVGDVYCLSQKKEGYPQGQQFVQATSVKSEIRKFTLQNKEFERRVISIDLSQPLKMDFLGVNYPNESYADAPCKLLETKVADAARYYGVKPLVAAISENQRQLKIASLFEKLAPTSETPIPLDDLTAAGQRNMLYDGAKANQEGVVVLTINQRVSAGTLTKLWSGNAILPSSLVISTDVGEIKDSGGTLMLSAESVGTVGYARGEVALNTATNLYVQTLKFKPAAADLRVSETAAIDIEVNNRSTSYSINIDPPPAPGSLVVSYRVNDTWYDLNDDGSGRLRGLSDGHGSGNINFGTSTVRVNTSALPDVGSSILFAWATRGAYFNRSGGDADAKMVLQLEKDAEPSTLNLNWNNGADKAATCDALGAITGDWTGKYDAQNRKIYIDTDANFNHPAGLLDITASYSTGEKTYQPHKAPLRNPDGSVTLDLGGKPIKPGTFKMKWNLLIEDYDISVQEGESYFETRFVDPYKTVHDDSSGNIVDKLGKKFGTINYVDRSVTFNSDTKIKIPKSVYKKEPMGEKRENIANEVGGVATKVTPLYRNIFSHYEYVDAGAAMPIDESALVEVWFYEDGGATAHTEKLKSGDIEIDLLKNYAETIVPASTNFEWGGHRYFERNGRAMTNLDPKTGSAELAGTIDMQAGKATLTKWQWTNGAKPEITSLATRINGNPVDNVTFRTPASPLQPSSLQLRAVALDGTRISATLGADGKLTAPHIEGVVDVKDGLVTCRFGELVVAAGNESEDWYNAAAVDDNGNIWKPKHVFAETITYNATAYSYLAVDPKIVKIDTVRLPKDGRVPIFRKGDSILITNPIEQDIGSAHTAGQTVNLSRKNVDRICVTDANSKPVNAELWDYDLDEGTITWATPLDLSSYTMPITVTHVLEKRNRVTQADINGTLSLAFKIGRDFPKEGTYVSSLLIGGDLQVRHSIPFTQRNWNGEWSDKPVGKQLLNKLNLTDYPMILTDDGAITERWLIKMTSATTFEFYGERLGFVTRGDTLTDFKPINPATNKPYLTIRKAAFGNQAPWANQDVIRFNTWGTLLPVAIICAQQPTDKPQVGIDGFTQCLYGDTTEKTY